MADNYHYESELVDRIQAGAVGAEQELVNRYQRGVFAILRNRCADPDLCKDVQQDTWLIVIKKIRAGELRDSRRLNGFVTQIARNQLTMALRRSQKDILAAAETEIDIEGYAGNPRLSMEQKQLSNNIVELLKAMPKKRDRELIVRFYYYGDSKQELCERFKLSSDSFNSILARARNRFKTLWDQKNELFNK